MEEWKEYKISDICTGIYEGPHATPPNSQSGGIYLGIPAISNDGHIDFKNAKRISEEDLPKWTKRVTPQEDDIVFTNEATLNLYAIIPKDFYGCLGRRLGLIRPNKNIVNVRYLFYYFFSPGWRNTVAQNKVSGATVERILMTRFPSFPVKLPPMPIQNKIANILSLLDKKIEVNRRINDNLEQQAQALFKSWFVDFEPFKNGEFVESELGMIPKGWRVCSADEVFDINIGKTPPRKEPEWFTESKEDNVWVSIADMGSCGVFISDSSEYLTDEAIKRFNVLMVEKDSVLLSFKLTVGRVAIADTRLTTNEAIARFILPDKCYREFLYLYLKQYKYENLGSTSSIATAVNSKTIKGMKLIVPPTDIIESFSNNTRPLFEQIRSLQQESRRLAELRDTLLPKLMSGEIKVNEVEI